MSVAALESVRDRVLPMLRFAAEEYRHRTPAGYPVVVDEPGRGLVGLELDPNFALYFVTDGTDLFVETYRRAARNDARTSASRQKHGGLPFNDRRPIDPGIEDQSLRNLVAELMSHFNFQPGIIHITDS
ncbi:MAG: hypothetical protein AVDCRST_MAG73-3172 [uncultured Thermomicrobiales bacterium]|uniref:Uncharacterized protein n=1 Tax=uncultured Thermomicrobiales bacterium TaxID=1645740 RepID=A0A6J4UQ00_9BACT|nr:MAG: hypothetical protein AVDCRST_MAG73-3172 [uncultured Thermomicrobiales bacterium]